MHPEPRAELAHTWRDLTDRILRPFLLAGLVLVAVATAYALTRRPATLTEVFFWRQDLAVFAGMGLLVIVLFILRLPRAAQPPRIGAGLALTGLAGLAGLAALAGAHFVYEGFALSMDEFMATFDARIFAGGALAAPVAADWRGFEHALQPIFLFTTADGGHWSSGYLPLNAGLRALFGLVGAEAALNPLLVALSVVMVFAVARRLWPERPASALIAAVLMATSPQLVVAGMTPYAMTAHAALNLVWLWLFLRGRPLGYAAALAVAFVACGLHQMVFHPLFAAPFVLQLWLDRRWRLAGVFTLAYAAICLFWVSYWSLAPSWSGVGPLSSGAAGAGGLVDLVLGLLGRFGAGAVGTMAENLVRFASWQSLLTVPLLLISLRAAFAARGVERSLALGLILTVAAVFVLMPSQGHGWGYRYLHGLLGPACLLAAWTWSRLTEPLEAADRGAAQTVFALAAVGSLVLIGVRAWQANDFVHPYAAASRAIQGADADVVLVDDAGVWFGADLVRNDPWLRTRPRVLLLQRLSAAGVRTLCRRGSVSLFGRQELAPFGIRTFDPGPEDLGRLRARDVDLAHCGQD